MDMISKGIHRAVLLIILTFVASVTSVSASTPNQQIAFAIQIIDEVSALEGSTSSSGIPDKHSKQLNNRLKITRFQLEKGINKLQQNKQPEAIKRFKNAQHFINRYLKLLSQKVDRDYVEPLQAEPLATEAKNI